VRISRSHSIPLETISIVNNPTIEKTILVWSFDRRELILMRTIILMAVAAEKVKTIQKFTYQK